MVAVAGGAGGAGRVTVRITVVVTGMFVAKGVSVERGGVSVMVGTFVFVGKMSGARAAVAPRRITGPPEGTIGASTPRTNITATIATKNTAITRSAR